MGRSWVFQFLSLKSLDSLDVESSSSMKGTEASPLVSSGVIVFSLVTWLNLTERSASLLNSSSTLLYSTLGRLSNKLLCSSSGASTFRVATSFDNRSNAVLGLSLISLLTRSSSLSSLFTALDVGSDIFLDECSELSFLDEWSALNKFLEIISAPPARRSGVSL